MQLKFHCLASRRSVLKFKFSVFMVPTQLPSSMSCQMSIGQKQFNEKNFNSNPCPMRWCISIKGVESRILVYLVWPWYSTRENLRMTILHAKNQFKVAICNEWSTFFFGRLIWTNGVVVKASSSESDDMGSIPADVENPCHFAAILQGLTRTLLYCRFLYNFFFLIFVSGVVTVAISRWRALTLDVNIQLPLFWSAWSQARTRLHVQGWGMGVIIAIV